MIYYICVYVFIHALAYAVFCCKESSSSSTLTPQQTMKLMRTPVHMLTQEEIDLVDRLSREALDH